MRRALGVTCLECGCLNFSSVHEKCDRCRSKTLAIHPTARELNANDVPLGSQGKKYPATRVSFPSKKRSYDQTRVIPRTEKVAKGSRNMLKLALPAVKSPDVIDLISDDEDEDVKVHQVAQKSAPTVTQDGNPQEVDDSEARNVLQSRVFSTVAFKASDFSLVAKRPQMRVEQTLVPSQLANQTNGAKCEHEKTYESEVRPIAEVCEALNGIGEQNPVELRPLLKTQNSNTEEAQVQILTSMTATLDNKTDKVDETMATTKLRTTESVASAAASGAKYKEAQVVQTELLFQSRVYDNIEFKDSDFSIVSNGLALARRSHPKSPASNSATSRLMEPAAGMTANPVKMAFLASSTPSNFAIKKMEILPSTTYSPSKTLTLMTATNTLTNASAAATLIQSQCAKLSPKSVATTGTVLPLKAFDTRSTPDLPTLMSKSSYIPVTPVEETLPRKIASSPKQVSSAPELTSSTTLDQNIVSALALPKSSQTTTSVLPLMAPCSANKPAATSTSAAWKESSAYQTTATTIVRRAKKRHHDGVPWRTDAEKRQYIASSSIDATPSTEADAFDLVKEDAAALESLPVERPVLGYCRPEFLALMRECGDESKEEQEDLEDKSRSQLRLLDVVDLSHLSDFEESDALPTPRMEMDSTMHVTGGQAGTRVSTGSAPGVNPSERIRTQPEKAVCELCEEKGALYRLVQCPTCTKYYHKKCAKENGDENVCWNCELGSLIDDSELDEEHAKHSSEYLTYLKALQRSGDTVEEEEEEEEERRDGDDAANVDMARVSEEEESAASMEGHKVKSSGQIWIEFLGGVTADIDASYHKVTNQIAEELRDDEKKSLYTRGFVSREEFEAQMTEVEDYYISKEARLQQLERDKAVEAKNAAVAKKARAEAQPALRGQQLAATRDIDSIAPSLPAAGDRDGVTNDLASPPTSVDNVDKSTSPATAEATNCPSVLSQRGVSPAPPTALPALPVAPASVPTVAQPATFTILSTRVAALPLLSTP